MAVQPESSRGNSWVEGAGTVSHLFFPKAASGGQRPRAMGYVVYKKLGYPHLLLQATAVGLGGQSVSASGQFPNAVLSYIKIAKSEH